jgi:hypothetical protein
MHRRALAALDEALHFGLLDNELTDALVLIEHRAAATRHLLLDGVDLGLSRLELLTGFSHASNSLISQGFGFAGHGAEVLHLRLGGLGDLLYFVGGGRKCDDGRLQLLVRSGEVSHREFLEI